MLTNGKQIPAAQLAVFKCPECSDTIFEVKQCVRMCYDRLDPEQNLKPAPVMLVQCVNCRALITRDKETGGWTAVHVIGDAPDPGEEWKK